MSTLVKSVENNEPAPYVQTAKKLFPGYIAKEKSKLQKNRENALPCV